MEKDESVNQFELLNFFPKPLSPDQVSLKVHVDHPPQLPPEVKAGIDEKWATLPTDWNGDMLGLIRTEESHNSLVLHTKPIDYKTHQGTNLHPENFTRMKESPDLLGNGLVCTAVIITSDGKLVFGLRSNGKLGTIGGTVNTDETFPQTSSVHLFMHQDEEIQQELGLTNADMEDSDTRLLSVSRSRTNLRPLLTFIHHTRLSSDEINNRFLSSGDKSEHSRLFFIPNDPDSISTFLSHPPLPVMPAAIESTLIHRRSMLTRPLSPD